MDFNQAAATQGKAFSFTECLDSGEMLEAHSFGNGRFITRIPSRDVEVCFGIYKTRELLNIHIFDDDLLRWLHTIPSMHDGLEKSEIHASISMRHLLPCYPDVREKFSQEKGEGHNFDALDLFFCHFLREGSVFSSFGLNHLHEEQVLTELHFHDIRSQYRSLSEDLVLLDDAIDEVGEQDGKEPSYPFMHEPLRSQLRAAIHQRDTIAVGTVLAKVTGVVDVETLCFAIRRFERTIFDLLLEHGAQTNGCDVSTEPLYLAAKSGHLDAVRLLISHGASKEGNSLVMATPLSGAASGGHLDIVQYLVEDEGANIDGNGFLSPLDSAIIHHHTHIIDYLFRAGADVSKLDCLQRPGAAKLLLGCGLDLPQMVLNELLHFAARHGDPEAVQHLLEAGADVNSGANIPLHNRCRISPLAVGCAWTQIGVAHFLSSAGAILLEGENKIRAKGHSFPSPDLPPFDACSSVGKFLQMIEGNHPVQSEESLLGVQLPAQSPVIVMPLNLQPPSLSIVRW
ncbi:hypothetical protein Daus18300_000353 [Diaporthe australafricana]|uniref:Ankyrin repeat protein n=1 Tax=Diaporthe australafricana TaxID=127596 RepID=A0ABR3Y5T1_9PEZI